MSHLVGILNITPDSFSDGGQYTTVELAVAQVQAMIKAGAAVVDIGAESTRPGATPLTHAQEWQRLAPVLEALRTMPITLSVDTYHPETASKALALGVQWINDVSGFTNPAMVKAVQGSEAMLVVMHHVSVPARKEKVIPENKDVVEEVLRFARERMMSLTGASIAPERIIFDPGIGFGKTAKQSLQLLKHIAAFKTLGVKLLVGHSRKSCFTELCPSEAAERDPETLAASLYLAQKGVDYLRVHNIEAHAKALRVGEYLWS